MTKKDKKQFYSADLNEFLFNNLSCAVLLVDTELRIQKVNNAFKSMYAKEESDVLNELCGNALGCSFAIEQNTACGSTSECKTCTIRSCLINGFNNTPEIQNTYITRNFYIRETKHFKYLRLNTKHVSYKTKSMAIIIIDDITELEEQKNQIREMANRDFLTNLYNRRYFYDIGENLFQNAKRENFNISVAMMDIDYFKKVNDTYGHAAGDFVLKTLAVILQQNLRKADIIARFGGEEFCILLHCRDNEDSYTVIDKLRLIVELHEFLFEGRKIHISISAGLTKQLEKTLDDMIKKADELLFKAKKEGRNRTEELSVFSLRS